jgi:RNA-splicing ligase RtcB
MEPITTISTIFSSIKTATDIAKLIKDSNTSLEEAEIKFKMAELISTLADIKIELSEVQVSQRAKEEKILELEKLLAKKERVIFKQDMYWMEGDEVPFCKVCFEKDAKYHHLEYKPRSKHSSEYHFCRICSSYYYKR